MNKILKQSVFPAIGIGILFSCTDVDIINVYQRALDGPKTTVKVVISTDFKNASPDTRSTAGDVNEGTNLLPIQNTVIASYIETGTNGFDPNDRSFGSLPIGTIDLENTTTTTRVMELPVGEVNFLFYGNGTKNNWSGLPSMNQGRSISEITFNLEDGTRSIDNSYPLEYYQQPAALFYWSATTGQKINPPESGEQTIYLNTVHYGVANFLTVVKNGTKGEGDISLAGVFVGGQSKIVDWNFMPVDFPQNKVAIFDNQINCPGTPTSPYLPTEYPGTLTPNNVNDYTLVFPTLSGQDVPVSLVVTSTEDIVLNNGLTAKAGTLIHLPPITIKASTASANNNQVFRSGYKTIARLDIFTLKNGDIIPQPLVTSNVTLGIDIDTQWEESWTFDGIIL